MSRENERAARGKKDSIRTFVCVEVPRTIKDRVEALQRSLKRDDAQVSWVKPANIHLTIKFLGDVPAHRVEAVRRCVERAAASLTEFEIQVAGAGCFPSPRSPRVLWVGLGPLPESLGRLHANVEDELAREGFPRERKPFSPHLTIGRVRGPRYAAAVAEGLIAAGFEPESFRAREIVVMRSDMSPSGSVYTPQAVIKLGPGS
jgi:2'-5' RNA ligase